MKKQKLTFSLNFPCWGAGEIQLYDSKDQRFTDWCRFESDFLTLASRLYSDFKWQILVKNLELADSSF